MRWTYERIIFNSSQREARNKVIYFRINKEKIQDAFFRLGFMEIIVDVKNPEELFQKMTTFTTNSILFKDDETKRRTLEACEPHLDLLNQEYLAGRKEKEITYS